MGQEDGDLSHLSNGGWFTLSSRLPERCLHQMLSALDFLVHKGIVHRDVKPQNILYSPALDGSGLQFHLSDFGVGTLAIYARSCQGTFPFMAPEIPRLRKSGTSNAKSQEHQPFKADVWSLFVIIALARNVCRYQSKTLETDKEILIAVKDASMDPWMLKYSAMVEYNPRLRASVHDILNNFFGGAGATEHSVDDEMYNDAEDMDLLSNGFL